jgi:hypothetical protein
MQGPLGVEVYACACVRVYVMLQKLAYNNKIPTYLPIVLFIPAIKDAHYWKIAFVIIDTHGVNR